MSRTIVSTKNAPKTAALYSQAVRCGSALYVSGQIPLDPVTLELVPGPMDTQIRRVFQNLEAIVSAAGGTLSQVVKLNVYMTDMSHFAALNRIMPEHFDEPYPARTSAQVVALPFGAQVEIDCVVELQ